MKIVFLDSSEVNPGDISWEPIEKLGEFKDYKRTSEEEITDRLHGAEAVFLDSVPLGRKEMERSPSLKFIGIAATGYNHVDLQAAARLGIAVTNVPAYSTDAVAQHTVALLLSITNRVEAYRQGVFSGGWSSCKETLRETAPLTLLSGKSMGIVGYGNIGKKVAELAGAFGMKVNIYSRSPQETVESDVVSLHCPLTLETRHLVDKSFIENMKDGAILLNTARGGLVDAGALAEALTSGKLTAAGLDVMEPEPPEEANPLIGLENCWITPHVAFTPYETRKTVVDTCGANLESFLKGERRNRLV